MDDNHIAIIDSISALKSENFIESHKAIIKLRRTLSV